LETPQAATSRVARIGNGASPVTPLQDERDIADRGDVFGATRRAGAPRWARELGAHVNHAGCEVEIVPDEAEHLGDAEAGVEDGRQHQPISGRAGREQALDLRAAEDALAAAPWPRALVVLEPFDRVGDDPTQRRASA
jgi:hypothetical protein